MRKAKRYNILSLVVFWLLSTLFIVSYEAAVLGFAARETGMPYSFTRILLITVLVTVVGATAVASCQVLLLSRLLRRRPYGVTLLAKTVFYLGCIFVFTSLAVVLVYSYDLGKPVYHREVLGRYAGYLSSVQVVMTMIYWGASVLVALFVLQVSEKFGQGVLLDFLLGKYHRPKEEQRIFMFMDLRSSTAYAERLGHIKYSQLIQDCFFDLTDVVERYRAAIYQYVGDEVVLTWSIASGVQSGNCIQIFCAYDETLRRRGAHYRTRYGLLPEFKAGLNAGRVTVAEVGEIKKELAYHGDVLNTASRIQGKCNELDRRLLVSEDMKELIDGQAGYGFGLIGDVALKGKREAVRIYDVKVPGP